MDAPLPLQSLLDSAPDGFVVVDADGKIVWGNQTAEKLFGYGDGELLGLTIEALVPERLRGGHIGHRTSFLDHAQLRPMGLGLKLLARRKDGSEFPVEISLSPAQAAQGTVVTAVVRDVTERRALEDERAILESELQTERERDRIAMDLHDGILQDIYAASLTLELALSSEADAAADSVAVERAIEQLHAVVRNIRSYIFDLRPRDFFGNLADALTALANEFQQNSQIETTTSFTGEGDVALTTAIALYNIAHESLSNVQKHSQAEKVTIKVEFDTKHGSGRMEVSDNGVGFDASVTHSEEHRGLRNMATRARTVGASFSIDSVPGKGSTSAVDFPTGNLGLSGL